MNEAVTVTGTPTLTLNDGGTATYTGGSGTNALTFSYTVGGRPTARSRRLRLRRSISNGATIKDGAGNAANLSGALTTFPDLADRSADAVGPTPSSIVESPSTGDLNAGNTVTLTLNLSEAVTVAGGTPTLTLNDGGTATYTGGSGTNALTFSYTVGAGQNTASLAATAVNLNGATIKDGAGNAANLSLQWPNPDRPADRHHDADGVVGGGVRHRHHGGAGDLGAGKRGDADGQPERGGDGCGRHPDADAQRRRHRDLYRRLRHQCADLQLHGGGRPEHRRPGGDGGQSRHRDRQGRRRQRRQSHRCGDQPGRHAADRHHGADGVVGGGLRHRHHGGRRRPRGRQAW